MTQVIKLKDGAVVEVKDNIHDPNGRWLGLDGEDLESAPDDIVKAIERDSTGKVWTNINENISGLKLGDEIRDKQ
jgi:hypothetical protein